MKHKIMFGALLAWTIILGDAPAAPLQGAEPAPTTTAVIEWIKTELYFGRDIPGGHEVSRKEWNEFLDQVITPKFPAGLTVLESYGQMRHAAGPIEKQSTWVVLLVHPKDAASDKAIQEVIAAYRQKFNNAQVMQLSLPVTARFFAD